MTKKTITSYEATLRAQIREFHALTFQLRAQIRALKKERDALKAALTVIASYEDTFAWGRVKANKSWGYFDEPNSVRIAHEALANAGEQQ